MKLKVQLLAIIFILISIFSTIYPQIIDTTKGWEKVAGNLNFPEGPTYDGKSKLYFSNCYGGWISKFENGKVETLAVKSDRRINISKTNGLAFGKDDHIYACEYGYGQIMKIDQKGNIEVFANGYNGEKFNRPNDLIFDEKGNLFFTDPKSYDSNILDGRVFFIDKKSDQIKLIADSLAFPNGINISPFDKRLYVCESAKHKIIRFDIKADSLLTNKTDFVYLPGGDPDGIEFDEKGNIYVAHYGGQAVYIFSPDGKLLQKIKTPGLKPTNLEFGDRDLKTLYLTEVETNSLYSIRVRIPGKKK